MLTVNSTLCNGPDAHFKYIQWAEADFKSQTWLYLILDGICTFIYFSSFHRTGIIHWWISPNLNSIEEWQIFCSSALPGHPAAQGNTSSDNRARYFLSLLEQIHSDTKYKLLGGGANKIQWQKCQNCDVLPIARDSQVILTQDFFCLLTSGRIFLRLWLPTCQFQGSRLSRVLFDILLSE